MSYYEINKFFIKLKLCLELYKRKEIKLVCNSELSFILWPNSKKYNDKNSKYTTYSLLYHLFSNFKKYGLKGLIDMRGKRNKKTNKLTEVERIKKRKDRLKKIKDSLTIEQMRELIDAFEEIFDSLDNSKKDKIKSIDKIKKKCSLLPLNLIIELLHISKSYYYKYKNIKSNFDNRYRKDKTEIIKKIKIIYFSSNCTYGSRRINAILNTKNSIKISYKTTYKYMKELGLSSIIRKKNKRRVDLKNTKYKCENLLKRNFKISSKNKSICTDVTYIKYRKKFIYLSASIDLRNNKIIGWSLSDKNNLELVLDNFKNIDLSEYDIVHSDHGIQYSSKEFVNLLNKNNIKQSMSNIGNSLDNRPIEYWFSILKEECIKINNIDLLSFDELKSLISNFIRFYNLDRIQLILKNSSPNEFERWV